MVDNENAPIAGLTPEQLRAVAEQLKPLADATAEQWRPLMESISQSLATSLSAMEQITQPMRETFGKLRFPPISLPEIDFGKLLVDFPSNLHLGDVERLADMALTDGIPICWVPRAEVLSEVLATPDRSHRYSILVSHRQEILNDCMRALDGRVDAWSDAARKCVDSARNCNDDTAQSHAANLIDSVILFVFGNPGERRNTGQPRALARTAATRDVNLDETVRAVARHLSVRPVPSAFISWYPGDPPPTAFNRHATTHLVGDPAVFNEAFCIVAVMLATSLARQFGSRD